MQEQTQKKIYTLAKKIIPESTIALYLRKLKWKLDEHQSSKNYDILNDVAILNLDSSIDQEIKFPYYKTIKPLRVHIELPGYFQVPIIKEGSTVVDAGSYPGDFTVVASRKVGPNGTVYAFEPDPDGRTYLEEMLKLNNISNVEIVPLALDASYGKVDFLKENNMLFDKRYNSKRHGQSTYTAETISLDEFFKDKKVDFIKMDIEGSEINAVIGAKNIINEMRPAFAIASYHRVDGKPTSIRLEQILKPHYKNVETIFPIHQTTYAFN